MVFPLTDEKTEAQGKASNLPAVPWLVSGRAKLEPDMPVAQPSLHDHGAALELLRS